MSQIPQSLMPGSPLGSGLIACCRDWHNADHNRIVSQNDKTAAGLYAVLARCLQSAHKGPGRAFSANQKLLLTSVTTAMPQGMQELTQVNTLIRSR